MLFCIKKYNQNIFHHIKYRLLNLNSVYLSDGYFIFNDKKY